MARQTQKLLRLNKYLADCGLASRRKADEFIEEGLVQVNGKTVYELGVRVDPSVDRVTLKGKPVKPPTQKIYVIFYKPESVVTSMDDPMGRPTVADFVRGLPYRVFPVGRLDWDTEGLLLLTNDGELANKITHPKHGVWKTYEAWLDKPFKHQEFLAKGVKIEQHRVVPVIVSIEGKKVIIKIHEGQKHVVRIMFERFGYEVVRLLRTQVASLSLGKLARGTYRELKRTELDYLKKILDHQ